MLGNRPGAIEFSREAIAVAQRVEDVFAEVNARTNLFAARAVEGSGPDPSTLLEIVEAAAAVGAHEEVYRAVVNFVWSAVGFISVDRIEAVVASARAGRVPAPPSIAAYLELSIAGMLLVPAGRWAEADAILAVADQAALSSASELLWRTTTGGLALRRGDLRAAGEVLAPLRPLALASGEPQRIIPMASVVLPWLLLTDRRDELRSVAREVIEAIDGQWPALISVDAFVRTLFAARERDLLDAVAESVKRSAERFESGILTTSAVVAQGLCELAAGKPESAVTSLEAAIERHDELGFAFVAACVRLELMRALEEAGDPVRAAAVGLQAEAIFAPLGCVNTY
jgi:hypothetical protein